VHEPFHTLILASVEPSKWGEVLPDFHLLVGGSTLVSILRLHD